MLISKIRVKEEARKLINRGIKRGKRIGEEEVKVKVSKKLSEMGFSSKTISNVLEMPVQEIEELIKSSKQEI